MTFIADLVSEVEEHLSITIPDEETRWAYNEFSSLVYRILQKRYDKQKKYVQTQIGAGGLDLTSVITDARNFDVGFQVFEGTEVDNLSPQDKFDRVHPGVNKLQGYFILDNTIFIKNYNGVPGKLTSAVNTIIFYRKKRTVLTEDDKLGEFEFEYDQDLEFVFRRYLQAIFFDGKFRPANVASAQSMAIQWLKTYTNEAQST